MSESKEELQVAAFRLPRWLRDLAEEKCVVEDTTFSQLMRKAIRKEMGLPSAKPPKANGQKEAA